MYSNLTTTFCVSRQLSYTLYTSPYSSLHETLQCAVFVSILCGYTDTIKGTYGMTSECYPAQDTFH